MSDDQEGPLAGQRLAVARKARDVSIFEIAKELHLDEHKVQALEENRFDTFGAPVFAKGHLRKYAQLVGVSIDDVMADYYTMNRAAGAPPVVGAVRKQARDVAWGPWLAGALLLAIVVAAYFLWPERTAGDDEAVEPEATSTEELASPAEPQEEPAVAAVEVPPADPAETDDALVQAAQTAVAPDIPSEPIVEPEPTTSGEVALSLSFVDDCWTEISDANGDQLFFDMGRSGRNVTVRGAPPLRVLLGNSDNVTLTVNGEDYPILPSMRRGRTARFTVREP